VFLKIKIITQYQTGFALVGEVGFVFAVGSASGNRVGNDKLQVFGGVVFPF